MPPRILSVLSNFIFISVLFGAKIANVSQTGNFFNLKLYKKELEEDISYFANKSQKGMAQKFAPCLFGCVYGGH